ncbi:MAG: hypothetical protein HY909_25920 [Deltaproteobacteria bacterium]|nr:hypothetical protein [Deltaproteobacteria bacterium]
MDSLSRWESVVILVLCSGCWSEPALLQRDGGPMGDACGRECPSGTECSSGVCAPLPSGCWRPVSSIGAPGGSVGVTPVWTGSEAIFWGGQLLASAIATGGRYDPAQDRWTPMSTDGAPSGRTVYGAVWTGSLFVVYGGYGYGPNSFLYDGGRYDPTTDRWTRGVAISYRGASGPVTGWTGSRMFVWSGGNGVDTPPLGVLYDPVANESTSVTRVGAPPGRSQAWPAPWTGTGVLVAGGGYAGGGIFDPVKNSWTPIASIGSPTPRSFDFGVWTGSSLVLWGGQDAINPALFYGTGAMYDPTSDRWSTTSTARAPSVRAHHCMVWTGSRVLVWGGANGSALLGDGAEFDPLRNAWSPMPAEGAPAPRSRHACVWTGREMIVWGGRSADSDLTDGARYVPRCGR